MTTAAPQPQRRTMSAGRLGGILVSAGALMTLVLALTDATYSNGHPAQVVIPSLVGLLLGLVCLALGARTPSFLLAAVPAVAGELVALSTWVTNTPVDGSELLYVWCIFFAGYFLPRRAAWANTVLLSVSYAVVVISRRGLSVGVPPAIELACTLVVACVLVSLLRHRAAVSLDEARTEARTDPLTGLLNRRGLAEVTAREVAHAERDGKPLALWMVDLDHFKGLNDELGHAAGDRALQAVSEVLRAELRAVDVIARVGGEEFCVLLPGCTTADAFMRAEELRERIAEEFRLRNLPVTVSIGVASWGNGDLDGNAMMVAADQALYAAKRSGRNNTQIAHGIPTGRRTFTEVR